jgi:hypothetical protein
MFRLQRSLLVTNVWKGLVMLLVTLPFYSDAQQPSKGMLSITFKHFVNQQELQLDTSHYKNELGQEFTISKFKYYISNIHLKKADGNEFISSEYFLIDEDEEQSKNIILQAVPQGEYTSISFMIGVDSLHNCTGAQSGSLDPVRGMFWAWNTGYIFLKLEGKSPASQSPGKIFEYHIGGYKSPANCIRRVPLQFTQPLQIRENKNTVLNIHTNVSEVLKAPSSIDFSALSSVTDFHHAELIADNYSDMFTIGQVSNE